MGLRDKLKRLEKDARLGGTLRLPDGTEVRHGPGELLDALLAAIDGEDHRLLPHLRQMPGGPGGGLPSLIRAIEGEPDGA